MKLADLLVYVDQTDGAAARLHLASDLARRHGCRLIALFVRECTPAQLRRRGIAELGLVSSRQIAGLDQDIQASIAGAEERLKSLLDVLQQEGGFQAEWRAVDGSASNVVSQHARCVDLCIVGYDHPGDEHSVANTFTEKLLFVTGRPVLFIPSGVALDTLGRRIVAAWNTSPAATRALNDALPLIERAEKTTILTVNLEKFIAEHGALPVEQMTSHLKRHDLSVDVVQLQNVESDAIADTLQAKACALRADLLVVGAFGPPKFWQDIVGGVTRDLLSRMRLPILMSH
jgi:nucleotide-binding universal stress UspA family protein